MVIHFSWRFVPQASAAEWGICMIKNYIENANFDDTGFAYTLSLISGKHKMVILYCLMEFETVRFNELKRYLKTISDKTLSTNLKELEADKLIVRTEYPQIPPKVEYSLSERGTSLMTVLDQLCVWGEENRLQDWQPFLSFCSGKFKLVHQSHWLKEVRPAAAIIDTILAECKETLAKMQQYEF